MNTVVQDTELEELSETTQLNIADCQIIQDKNTSREDKKMAFQQLCIRNEGLVNKAVYLCSNLISADYDADDLKQQAFLGLLRASKTFDPEKGAFSTYAFPWMKQYIRRAAMNCGSIRLPVHVWQTLLDLSKKYHVTVSDDRFSSCVENDGALTAEEKKKILSAYQIKCVVSLDTPVGEEEHGTQDTIGTLIAQSTSDTAAEALETYEQQHLAALLREVLNERERWVIKMRFIDNKTLEWCGEHMPDFKNGSVNKTMSITRERVRQIEETAIRKLRHALARKGIHHREEI